LDYAAGTPVAPEVVKAMLPYFKEKFGNPGSIHHFGQEAQSAVDKAREVVSLALGVKFSEIVFTGSATEANNLALKGVFGASRISFRGAGKLPKIIISAVEHESVSDTSSELSKEGANVIVLPVDEEGLINLEDLKKHLDETTVLVSVMYASNEIGVIEPIKEIAKIIKDFRGMRDFPMFHTDAVQVFQFLDCRPEHCGVDLMTLSAQKIYGPKGVGALFIRGLEPKGTDKIKGIITGGGQEYGLRSGTENVPAIVGFGKAVELIGKDKLREADKIKELRDYFWLSLKNAKPGVQLNGPDISSPKRLHNNLNIHFPGNNSEDLLIKLDLNGLAVSAGSACSARSTQVSRVIKALNLGEERAKSSLRFSFGRPTTKMEVDIALERVINLL